MQLRKTSGQDRPVPGQVLGAAVQVVEALTAEHTESGAEDLPGRSVAQRQLGRASADMDPEAAQRDLVAVDTLVGVTHEEDVVGGTRRHRP